MFCTTCGTPIREGSRFCTTCGTPVPNAHINNPAPNVPNQNIGGFAPAFNNPQNGGFFNAPVNEPAPFNPSVGEATSVISGNNDAGMDADATVVLSDSGASVYNAQANEDAFNSPTTEQAFNAACFAPAEDADATMVLTDNNEPSFNAPVNEPVVNTSSYGFNGGDDATTLLDDVKASEPVNEYLSTTPINGPMSAASSYGYNGDDDATTLLDEAQRPVFNEPVNEPVFNASSSYNYNGDDDATTLLDDYVPVVEDVNRAPVYTAEYEYKVAVNVSIKELEDLLNSYAASGWRAISINCSLKADVVFERKLK